MRDLFGTSQSRVYTIQDEFLNAVLGCDELQLTPLSRLNLQRLNKDFTSTSTDGVLRGCMGAMDGMLQPVNCPTLKESNGNQRSYHSGHYNCYGLNIQALCDAHLRLLYFA